jgi:CarD family transcriptional regulator
VSFQVGDKVIYPNHGLGVVEKIEEKTILGTTCGFFHLRILSNETTVLVPVVNVDNVGLRRAITDEEVERLFHLLGDGKIDNHQNWKGRFKDNSDKMRTGSIYDMADVLKSLTFLAKSKSLSFREADARSRQGADHLGGVRSDASDGHRSRRPSGKGAGTLLHDESAQHAAHHPTPARTGAGRGKGHSRQGHDNPRGGGSAPGARVVTVPSARF